MKLEIDETKNKVKMNETFQNEYKDLIGKYFVYSFSSYLSNNNLAENIIKGYIQCFDMSITYDAISLRLFYSDEPNMPTMTSRLPIITNKNIKQRIIVNGFYYADTMEEAELEYELQRGE